MGIYVDPARSTVVDRRPTMWQDQLQGTKMSERSGKLAGRRPTSRSRAVVRLASQGPVCGSLRETVYCPIHAQAVHESVRHHSGGGTGDANERGFGRNAGIPTDETICRNWRSADPYPYDP